MSPELDYLGQKPALKIRTQGLATFSEFDLWQEIGFQLLFCKMALRIPNWPPVEPVSGWQGVTSTKELGKKQPALEIPKVLIFL